VAQGRDVFIRSPWHQLRHPLIFYYGHVAALYINKLRVAGLIKEAVDEELEQIVETGVDEMSWDDLSKNEMEWPDLRTITEYRRTVYGIVRDVILNGAWSFPINISDPAWAIIMGFEHERIHLETSSVLMRELPAHLVTRPSQFAKYHPSAFDGSAERVIQNQMLPVEGGEVKLGKPRDWRSFGWDNEYGTRTAKVESFAASKFLITNGEFLEFVRSGGYGNKAYWTEAGWQWRVFRNIHFPTFWCPDGPVRRPLRHRARALACGRHVCVARVCLCRVCAGRRYASVLRARVACERKASTCAGQRSVPTSKRSAQACRLAQGADEHTHLLTPPRGPAGRPPSVQAAGYLRCDRHADGLARGRQRARGQGILRVEVNAGQARIPIPAHHRGGAQHDSRRVDPGRGARRGEGPGHDGHGGRDECAQGRAV
jgi:hypothetical protein